MIKSFQVEDLAKEVTGIKLDLIEAPLLRSLGVSWDISKDSFTFQVSSTKRPFTKRGALATINGLYDPICCSSHNSRQVYPTGSDVILNGLG